MDNRGRRGRRNRHTIHYTDAASIFGLKSLMVTIFVVTFAWSMLQYNRKNSQAKRELMLIANSVNDIAKELNVIQNSYQLLEDKFAICSQEFSKIEEQVLASGSQVMEANRIGWNPKIHSRLPYIDVNSSGCVKVPIKNSTKAKNIYRLLSEFERKRE